MNCESYQEFVKTFGMFKYNFEHKRDSVSSFGSPSDKFVTNIQESLVDCRIFEMPEGVKRLLLMTKAPKDNIELKFPFDINFLDVSFTKEELAQFGINVNVDKIVGIMFKQGVVQDLRTGEKAGVNLRMTFACILGDEFWFDTFHRNVELDYGDETKIQYLRPDDIDRKAQKFVHSFVVNFLNLLHSDEHEYVEYVRSQKNRERRIQKGLIPLPNTFICKVTGRMKMYVDRFENEQSERKYGYRFEVRGHWRRLQNPRYKKSRTWVNKYEKGQGVLVKKIYRIEKGQND